MIEKKIVLVTGSTSGIGKAIAKELLREGYIVIINSNNEFTNDEINTEFEGRENLYFYQADIAKKQEIVNMRNWIEEQFGRLDWLVANAGILPKPCGIDNITDDNIEKTISTNLKGTFWTLKIMGEFISKTSLTGSIVTITSVDGIIGEPYGVIYSATKAGVISLAKSFARHYKNPLVRVNGVAPGLIDTPLTDSVGEDPCWTTDVSIIKRVGKAVEVAHAVLFLLSDKASFITGQIMIVDGGFTLK